MKLTIEFYGRLKSEFSPTSIELDMTDFGSNVSLKEIYLKICQSHQVTADTQIIKPILNDTFADWNDVVKANDVVGFFPPASGG